MKFGCRNDPLLIASQLIYFDELSYYLDHFYDLDDSMNNIEITPSTPSTINDDVIELSFEDMAVQEIMEAQSISKHSPISLKPIKIPQTTT